MSGFEEWFICAKEETCSVYSNKQGVYGIQFSNGINHKIHSFKVHASMVFTLFSGVHSPP